MVFKSKAPLRIGLSGGGTDVSPYADMYGGAVINATISHYAHAEIALLDQQVVELYSSDKNQFYKTPLNEEMTYSGSLDFMKAMYNRLLRGFGPFNHGFRLSTTVDAPLGSGLGTSSTIMVALAGVFYKMLDKLIAPGELAALAYDVERNELRLPGGRQDHFAAAHGGINYIEFYSGDRVSIKPVILNSETLLMLENNLLLYYTAILRDSSDIIREQQDNVISNKRESIEAMHNLKAQSKKMYEALVSGRISEVGSLLDIGFTHKKKMAGNISSPLIDEIYSAALEAGATGGKISGAGGGGFMVFYCPESTREKVCQALHNFGGAVKPFTFSNQGVTTWIEK